MISQSRERERERERDWKENRSHNSTWYGIDSNSSTNRGGRKAIVLIQLSLFPWVKNRPDTSLSWQKDLREHLPSTTHHPHSGLPTLTHSLQLVALIHSSIFKPITYQQTLCYIVQYIYTSTYISSSFNTIYIVWTFWPGKTSYWTRHLNLSNKTNIPIIPQIL